MFGKNHKSGADVIRIIHNWHKAVDGRGLNENERSQYCEDMKFWILDDWMPWHRENKDYSLIDVNRLVYIICISLFHSVVANMCSTCISWLPICISLFHSVVFFSCKYLAVVDKILRSDCIPIMI